MPHIQYRQNAACSQHNNNYPAMINLHIKQGQKYDHQQWQNAGEEHPNSVSFHFFLWHKLHSTFWAIAMLFAHHFRMHGAGIGLCVCHKHYFYFTDYISFQANLTMVSKAACAQPSF